MLLIETASLVSSKSQLQTPFWESSSSSSPAARILRRLPREVQLRGPRSSGNPRPSGCGTRFGDPKQISLSTQRAVLLPIMLVDGTEPGSACSIPLSPCPPASINVQLCRGASPSVLGCRHLHSTPTGPWDMQHPWAPRAHRRCCSLRLLCLLWACVRRNYFEFLFKEQRRKKNYQGKFILGQF